MMMYDDGGDHLKLGQGNLLKCIRSELKNELGSYFKKSLVPVGVLAEPRAELIGNALNSGGHVNAHRE